MTTNSTSKSFLDARDHLSRALNDLEKVIFDKLISIKENKNSSVSDPQGQQIINNLNHEINSLQKTLAEIGIENEALKSQNVKSEKKLEHLKNNFTEVKKNIKFDLEKIQVIINQNLETNVDN
jgi:predicted RNase H-like nuclease (RuvC/YqgF family)